MDRKVCLMVRVHKIIAKLIGSFPNIQIGPQTNIGSKEESEVAGFFVFSQ